MHAWCRFCQCPCLAKPCVFCRTLTFIKFIRKKDPPYQKTLPELPVMRPCLVVRCAHMSFPRLRTF
jgi:hypothetical protein